MNLNSKYMDSLILKAQGNITKPNRKLGEFEIGIKKMGDGSDLLGIRIELETSKSKVQIRTKNNSIEFYSDEEGLNKITSEELREGILPNDNTTLLIYIKALADDTVYVKSQIGGFYNNGRKSENAPLLQLDAKIIGYFLSIPNRTNKDKFLCFGFDNSYISAKIQPQYEIINGTIEDFAILETDRSSVWSSVYCFSGSNGTLKGSVVDCIKKFNGFTRLELISEKNIKEESINPILGLPSHNGASKGYEAHIYNSNVYVDLDEPINENGNISGIFKVWQLWNGTKSRGDLSVARKGMSRVWANSLAEGYSFSWKGGPNYSWDEDAVNFGNEVRLDMKMAPADEIDDFIVSLSKSPKVVSTSNISIKGTCSYTNPSSLRYEEVVNAVNTIRQKGATLIIK